MKFYYLLFIHLFILTLIRGGSSVPRLLLRLYQN